MTKNNDNTFAHEPSSQGQLESGKDALSDPPYADRPDFSPKRRRWEGMLRDHLGSFYYPLYVAAKERSEETAWDYVEDIPGLPRILIIGDSISRGCTLPVRHRLAGKANVHRAPENCGGSGNALTKLEIWLDQGAWDIILFNFGIHDRYTDDKTYSGNLTWIVDRLEKTEAKLFWVTSTPVPEGADEYVPGAIDRLNGIATNLMKTHGISVFDLYDYIRLNLDEFQLPDNCHFKNEGYESMGHFLVANLGLEPGPTPAPPGLLLCSPPNWYTRRAAFWEARERDQGAVVFLGDSITQHWSSAGEILPDVKMANRGIHGDTTDGVLFRLKEDVLSLNPNSIVLLLGTNDLGLRGRSPEDTVVNLGKILDAIEAYQQGLPVIFCTLLPRDNEKATLVIEVNTLLRELVAARPAVCLCDTFSPLADAEGRCSIDEIPDGLHPNEKGYEKMIRAITPHIQPH